MGIERVAMWSNLCYDWKPQPGENIVRRLEKIGAGDIVLMHDGDFKALNADREHVLFGLEHWLPRWRDAGMEFVTIEPARECAGLTKKRGLKWTSEISTSSNLKRKSI